MTAVFIAFGLFALIGVTITVIAAVLAVDVLLTRRRDRHRISLERLASPADDPELDAPSLDEPVVEPPRHLRRIQ